MQILDHNQCQEQKDDSYRHGDPCTLRKSGYDIGDKGDHGYYDNVGQLGGYVIDVVTLCACGSHDRRIGDGRAVIAAYRACHTGGDGDDHQLWIGIHKYIHNNRDENTKRSPGSSGRESEETCHDENDSRQEVHEGSRTLMYGIGYEGRCAQ